MQASTASVAVVSLALLAVAVAASQIPISHHGASWHRGPPDRHLAKPSLASPESTLKGRLDAVLEQIEQLKNITGVAGVSIGVSSNNQTVLDHHLGYADVERKIVANASTRYVIGSMTKAFVTATLANLIDDDSSAVSSWDDNVADHMADLDLALSNNHLSLIDMLSHRTGLSRMDSMWLGAEGQTLVNKSATVKLCNHLQTIYPVRSKFLYNNWMYGLAGQLIERLDPAGQAWGDVLFERLLRPLGLLQTTVRAADLEGVPIAQPYNILADKTPVLVKNNPPLDDDVMASAGGIRSTSSDMLKWGNALLALTGREPKEAEAKSSLDDLFAGHSFLSTSAKSDDVYGLGWAKAVTPADLNRIGSNSGLVKSMPQIGSGSGRYYRVLYHSGAIPGYQTFIALIPQLKAVVVVLTNSIPQGGAADWIGQVLVQATLGDDEPKDITAYAREAAETWRGEYQVMKNDLAKSRKPDEEPPPSSALVGTYVHSTNELYLEVFEAQGELRFSIGGRPEQTHTLSHHANDKFSFFPASDDERLSRGLFHYDTETWLLDFKNNINGKYTEIQWAVDGEGPDPESFLRKS